MLRVTMSLFMQQLPGTNDSFLLGITSDYQVRLYMISSIMVLHVGVTSQRNALSEYAHVATFKENLTNIFYICIPTNLRGLLKKDLRRILSCTSNSRDASGLTIEWVSRS